MELIWQVIKVIEPSGDTMCRLLKTKTIDLEEHKKLIVELEEEQRILSGKDDLRKQIEEGTFGFHPHR